MGDYPVMDHRWLWIIDGLCGVGITHHGTMMGEMRYPCHRSVTRYMHCGRCEGGGGNNPFVNQLLSGRERGNPVVYYMYTDN